MTTKTLWQQLVIDFDFCLLTQFSLTQIHVPFNDHLFPLLAQVFKTTNRVLLLLMGNSRACIYFERQIIMKSYKILYRPQINS